jgi:hypothetical protein
MKQSLTEWAQQNRLIVVAVSPETNTIRVRDLADQCTEIACGEQTLVAGDDLTGEGLAALGPGDVIRIDERGDSRRIVVVRHSWDEIGSPEF